MPWPMSQDYNEVIQTPAAAFSDPELKTGQPVCNAMGLPVPCSGNFADVYAVQTPHRKWAVKCFTREIPGIRERYIEISKYLAQQQLPFMVEFKFLDQGIRVRGQWYPVLKMHWVEGFALNTFVKQQVAQPPILNLLCQMWVKMAARLREGHLAHCDLQHGNVLMVPGAKAGMLSLKLVDYDGMCVPALELLKSIEVGHPNFQHPQRLKEGTYSIDVDRFSHLVIYTALRALMVGGPTLWQKFDNGDNLLFKQSDLAAPGKSNVFGELDRLPDPQVKKLVTALATAAAKPIDQVPLLEELAGEPGGVSRSVAAPAEKKPTTGLKKAVVVAPVPTSAEPAGDIVQIDRKYKRNNSSANLGLIIGGITTAIVLLGAAAMFLLMGSGGKPTRTEMAATPTPTVPEPPPTQKEPSATKKEAKVQPKFEPKELLGKLEPKEVTEPSVVSAPKGTWTDVLKEVNLLEHVLAGTWQRNAAGGLEVQATSRVPKIAIPSRPGGSYDFRVEFTRTEGNESVSLMLPVADRSCRLVFSAFNGQFSGLDLVEGMRVGKNAATVSPGTLTNGQRYTCLVKVRVQEANASIDVTLNDKPFLQWAGPIQHLETWVMFQMPGNTLGLAVNLVPATFHKAELRLVDDKGTMLAKIDPKDEPKTDPNKPLTPPEPKLIATLQGHTQPIYSVAFSPDGKMLASAGGAEKTVKLWNVASHKNTAILQGHTNEVVVVAFSSDGTLASGGEDKTIRLWNLGTGKSSSTLEGHSNSIGSVAISPDGMTLASAGAGDELRLWDLRIGKNTATLQGHRCVAFSPDGKSIASAGSDTESIKLWDIASGKNTATLRAHLGYVSSVAFSPDGKTLASGNGTGDSSIKLWDVASGKNTATLKGHTQGVFCLVFAPDGKSLASGSIDAIRMWDVISGENTATVKAHAGRVHSLAFSPDGRMLASASGDRTIKLWELQTASIVTKQPDVPTPQVAKNPIPPATDITRADKLLKDLFKADYAKRLPAEKKALAEKLLAQGQEGKDEPAIRYVCYREARDLAAGVPDPLLALKAVDVMAGEFVIPELETKAAALELAGRAPSTPESNKALFESASGLIDAALEDAKHDLALSLAKTAQSGAIRSKQQTLITAAASRVRDVEGFKREHDRLQAALETLKTKPDDPATNLQAGTYYCLIKGDWPAGLPHLAKGNDAKQKDLAAKDLAGPKEAKEQAAVGDGWYELAEGNTGLAKKQLQRRAAFWYQQALPGLTGLEQTRVEGRLKGLGSVPPQPQEKAPKIISLQLLGLPKTYVSHANFIAVTSKTSAPNLGFITHPGLSDRTALSFESAHLPMHYLRHGDFQLKLSRAIDDEGFRKDATFRAVKGLARDTWVSYEAVNYPGMFIRHKNGHFFVERPDGSAQFRTDATFLVVEPP